MNGDQLNVDCSGFIENANGPKSLDLNKMD